MLNLHQRSKTFPKYYSSIIQLTNSICPIFETIDKCFVFIGTTQSTTEIEDGIVVIQADNLPLAGMYRPAFQKLFAHAFPPWFLISDFILGRKCECFKCVNETKNPNPFPIGNKFGFFMYGGDNRTRFNQGSARSSPRRRRSSAPHLDGFSSCA